MLFRKRHIQQGTGGFDHKRDRHGDCHVNRDYMADPDADHHVVDGAVSLYFRDDRGDCTEYGVEYYFWNDILLYFLHSGYFAAGGIDGLFYFPASYLYGIEKQGHGNS